MSKQKPWRIYNVNVNQFFMGFLVAWVVFWVYCELYSQGFLFKSVLLGERGGEGDWKREYFHLIFQQATLYFPSLIQTVFQTLFPFHMFSSFLSSHDICPFFYSASSHLFMFKIKPFSPFRLVFFQPLFLVEICMYSFCYTPTLTLIHIFLPQFCPGLFHNCLHSLN